jgi:small conductance mechanosensitive channel
MRYINPKGGISMNFIKNILNWLGSMGLGILSRLLPAIIIAAIGFLLIQVVMKVLDKALAKSKLEKAAFSLIKTLVKTVLLVLLGLIVASKLGIDVTGIVALASVVTLAFSLALQNLLANVIGGFTILYTHPFHSGDYVEIAGQGGTVNEVGISYTKLITPDNKLISIPNSAVVAAQIVNYTTLGLRRVSIDISASYDAPAQLVIDTLVATAKADSRVLEEPAKPYAVLMSYGDSAINYSLRYWVDGKDYWDTVFDINKNIKVAFDGAGIEMTYPHLNVHLDK